MRNYRLLVLCDHCDRMHPTGSTLGLNDGLVSRPSPGPSSTNECPPLMTKLKRNAILCRESGKSVMLYDPGKLYIVPIP
jgi:hypothetical protein